MKGPNPKVHYVVKTLFQITFMFLSLFDSVLWPKSPKSPALPSPRVTGEAGQLADCASGNPSGLEAPAELCCYDMTGHPDLENVSLSMSRDEAGGTHS